MGVNEKGSYVSPLGLTDHRNVPLGVPVAMSIQRSIFAFRNYIFTNRNL